MNMTHSSTLTRSSAFIGLAACLASPLLSFAQYAPPPPPSPFPGFINEALRKDDPYMNAWDFGGSLRVRYELKDGNGIAGVPGSLDFRQSNADNHNAYFLERLRVRASYTDTWWSAFVEGRSSLAQNDERFGFAGTPRHKGHGPESDPFDLHQAFVTVGNHKEFPLSLKLGRQEMIYADERFIGAFAWNNIGRVFDAAKVRWQNSWFAADIFTSRPVLPEEDRFNESSDYESFSGIYATSTKVPKHTLDVFLLSRNATPQATTAVPAPQAPVPSARDIYSIGVRLKSKPGDLGPWDYTIDAVGQFGNFRDTRAGAPSSRLDHTAYAFIVQGGYTFKDTPMTPRLGLEFATASGDSDPTDGDHGTFENLYPTNHKFYGYADFISLQNIHDLRAIFQLKPTPRLSLAVEGHAFWLADTSDNFYNVGGAPRGGITSGAGRGYGIDSSLDPFVGTEVDLVAGYALTRYAQLEAGYAHFFTGSYIDDSLADPAFGSRDANWFYAQLNVNF
ncbi:MAG: alginate export family protein [Verrucomicrobiales bacterium]|nr:alginate export family protein [Verrucomicrobiales bacterium]